MPAARVKVAVVTWNSFGLCWREISSGGSAEQTTFRAVQRRHNSGQGSHSGPRRKSSGGRIDAL